MAKGFGLAVHLDYVDVKVATIRPGDGCTPFVVAYADSCVTLEKIGVGAGTSTRIFLGDISKAQAFAQAILDATGHEVPQEVPGV